MGSATAFDPSPDSYVMALRTDGTRIATGGSFTHVRPQPRAYLTALEASTGDLTSFNGNANLNVNVPGRQDSSVTIPMF